MKRFMFFAITIFIILPLVFTGCKDEPEVELESMTFVDDPLGATKEFIIYENLEFKVTFVASSEFLETFPFMEIGDYVTGKVTGTTQTWKDDVIEGIASQMTSNNEELAMILNELGSMDFKIEYIKQSGNIVALKVAFPGEGELDQISDLLMGGDYYKKL
ncbi:MAG: hypothetical protein FWB95_06150 [Treponema sp.]|nr:hypothetical protein [Treponema sp.]